MADDPKSVSSVLSASLPQAIAAGMFAIGALLISMQVQQARIEAAVQSTASAIQDLKSDSRSKLADLDQRVRALEIKN
jgi:hypothetical protein